MKQRKRKEKLLTMSKKSYRKINKLIVKLSQYKLKDKEVKAYHIQINQLMFWVICHYICRSSRLKLQ